MTDIASLGVEIKSGQIEAGSQKLDEFASKAAGAETAVQGLERATDRLEATARGARKPMQDLASATTSLGAGQFNNTASATEGLRNWAFQAQAAAKAQEQVAPAVDKASAAIGKQGTQAKYTAQQMTQLGFQTNDFFVQVASGQSPLLAAIQQGSQLSGTFGGIGGALRAVGSLITPVRVAIGGLAGGFLALAAAANEGDNESARLRDTILLTGNAAALTEGRFNDMAEAVQRASGGTIGSSRETLSVLAASGRFTSETLEATAQTVQKLASISGQSTDEVSKDFIKATDGVTRFADQINKSYNFLSVEQYKYIKQLEEQGQADKALLVLDQALYEHLGGTAPRNLGVLESAWKSVKSAISGAWDSLKAFGRDTTTEERIAEIGAAIKQLESGGVSTQRRGSTSAILESLKAEQAMLQEKVRLERRSADAQEANAQREKARIEFFKLEESSLTKQERLTQELANARAKAQAAGATPEQTNKVLDAIRKKYSGSSSQEDVELARQKSAMEQERKLYDQRGTHLKQLYSAGLMDEAEYYAGRETLQQQYMTELEAGFQTEQALLRARLSTAEPEKQVDIQKKMIESQQRYNETLSQIAATGAADQIERIGRAQKEAMRLTQQATQSLANDIAARDAANRALREENEAIGLTQSQLRALTIARMEETIAKEEERLATMRMFGAREDEIAQEQIRIDQMRERLALRRAGDEKQETLDQDAMVGAKQGLDDYMETLKNAGVAARSAVSQGFTTLENDLTESLTSGEFSVKNFINHVVQEFTRLAIIRPMLQSLFGGGGGVQGGAGGFASLIGGIAGMFGGGGNGQFAYTDSSGAFSMVPQAATGTNRVARDGLAYIHKDEAIIPAAYNPDAGGKKAGGGGNTFVTVEDHAGGKVNVEETNNGQDKMLRIVVDRAVGEVDKRIQTGGSTSKSIQGAFGSRPNLPRRG